MGLNYPGLSLLDKVVGVLFSKFGCRICPIRACAASEILQSIQFDAQYTRVASFCASVLADGEPRASKNPI